MVRRTLVGPRPNPVGAIGSGRRLFAEGTAFAGFELLESSASASGVILAKYRRAGDVKSGSFALPA